MGLELLKNDDDVSGIACTAFEGKNLTHIDPVVEYHFCFFYLNPEYVLYSMPDSNQANLVSSSSTQPDYPIESEYYFQHCPHV